MPHILDKQPVPDTPGKAALLATLTMQITPRGGVQPSGHLHPNELGPHMRCHCGRTRHIAGSVVRSSAGHCGAQARKGRRSRPVPARAPQWSLGRSRDVSLSPTAAASVAAYHTYKFISKMVTKTCAVWSIVRHELRVLRCLSFGQAVFRLKTWPTTLAYDACASRYRVVLGRRSACGLLVRRTLAVLGRRPRTGSPALAEFNEFDQISSDTSSGHEPRI